MSFLVLRGSAARGGDQTLQVRLHPGRLSGAAERRGEPAAESAQHGGGVVWKRDGQGRGRPAPAQVGLRGLSSGPNGSSVKPPLPSPQESGVSVSQRSSWNKRQTVDRGQTAEGAASPGRHSGPGLMLHRRSETQSCFFFFLPDTEEASDVLLDSLYFIEMFLHQKILTSSVFLLKQFGIYHKIIWRADEGLEPSNVELL